MAELLSSPISPVNPEQTIDTIFDEADQALIASGERIAPGCRFAERLSNPFDPRTEAVSFARFMWGNVLDERGNRSWEIDERIDPSCVTDGARYFTPDKDEPGKIREVYVLKNAKGLVQDIAGVTEPVEWRHNSPLLPGNTVVIKSKKIIFWD